MDWCQNQDGSFKSTDALCIAAEADEEELDFTKVDKPRPIERCKSCEVRSLSELSKVSENSSYSIDHLDKAASLQPKSGMNTPGSLVLDPQSHPIVSEGWEALMRSLVYFRGQRVGTIAAMDSSDEKINYDQVHTCCHLLIASIYCFLESVWFSKLNKLLCNVLGNE